MSNKDTKHKNISNKALSKDQLENVSGGFKYRPGYRATGPWSHTSGHITMSAEEQECIEKGKSTNFYKYLQTKYSEADCNRIFLLTQGYKQEL